MKNLYITIEKLVEIRDLSAIARWSALDENPALRSDMMLHFSKVLYWDEPKNVDILDIKKAIKTYEGIYKLDADVTAEYNTDIGTWAYKDHNWSFKSNK